MTDEERPGWKYPDKWFVPPMSDREKSVILARLCGWAIREGSDRSLYDPANMALAWRVLNWAGEVFELTIFWSVSDLFESPPAVAQRAWLDKILELATGAGMVEND